MSEDVWTDEELTELALAADPDATLDPDAIPIGDLDPTAFPALLPSWYMPTPASPRRSRRRAVVASTVIVSLLVINALGMCITNGVLEVP